MNTPHLRSKNNEMAYELEPQIFTPTTGQTITVANADGPMINFALEHTSTIATLTINMPNKPKNGQWVGMVSRSAVTTLTLNAAVAGGSFNIVAPTTIAAKAGIIFTWFESLKQWMRYAQTP